MTTRKSLRAWHALAAAVLCDPDSHEGEREAALRDLRAIAMEAGRLPMAERKERDGY